MNIKTTLTFSALPLLLIIHRDSPAEIYNWREWSLRNHPTQHNSPEVACRAFHKELTRLYDHILDYNSATPHEFYDWKWLCKINYIPDPDLAEEDGGPDPGTFTAEILLTGDSCEGAESFNKLTGMCEIESIDNSCPSSLTGNPINFLTGHKIQIETDFSASKKTYQPNGINFSRIYSSKNGIWAHSYSSHMVFDSDSVAIIHANGKKSTFYKTGENYKSKQPNTESLVKKQTGWTYYSPENHHYTFDETGRLSEIRKLGLSQNISYIENHITVTDHYGTVIEFTEDSRKQPLKLTSRDIQINYEYDAYKQLKSVTKTYSNKTDKKQYFYQDPRDGRLLTAMSDERGISYASWTYDNKGRAISSEHAGGAEKIHVNYNTDGSTTVTNELGKNTNYTFDFIQGIKRITAIDGEPTPSCPSSNSTFTYDERGLLKTQIDNKGNITTYIYNDRNLESSRTQASGTPQARTTSTEWHPTLFLPVTVTEPDRMTQYTYDAEGRQLSQTVTSR